jgi:hypothetical protein
MEVVMKAWALIKNEEFIVGLETWERWTLRQFAIFCIKDDAERAAKWYLDETGDDYSVVEVMINQIKE